MLTPEPTTETEVFWKAAGEQRLLLRFCPACQTWHHPQVRLCACGATNLLWKEASGNGTLVSFSVTRRVPLPVLAPHLPFTLLLVVLDEGPQLVSALPGEDYNLECGMRVSVSFEKVAEGLTLPRFYPASP